MGEQVSYTLEQIKAMSNDEAKKILNTPGAIFSGTGVVRGPDGKVKYDDKSLVGQYNEDKLTDMEDK